MKPLRLQNKGGGCYFFSIESILFLTRYFIGDLQSSLSLSISLECKSKFFEMRSMSFFNLLKVL